MSRSNTVAEVKRLIQNFVDLTVEENMTGQLNKQCDKLWNLIVEKLNKLGEE